MAGLALAMCSCGGAGKGAAADAEGGAVYQAAASFETTGFTDTAHWFDGKAEVATYQATRDRYGAPRGFEMTVINVSEALDPARRVKDDGGQGLPVIKTHVVYTMPTPNYDYHFASSTFTDRKNPFLLRKFVATSHEWCGITTKRIEPWHPRPELRYHSYFGDEASGQVALDWPLEGGVLEEQLLLALRTLPFEPGLRRPVSVLQRQTDSHAAAPDWRPGELVVVGQEMVEDAAGEEHQTWRVEIRLNNGDALLYNIATAHPHGLIYHEAPGGLTMRREEVKRWAYWDF